MHNVSERIIDLTRGDFYAYQLANLKRCFGPDSKIGCVTEGKTVYCGTIAELVAIGWAKSRSVRFDPFLRRIVRIGDKGWDN